MSDVKCLLAGKLTASDLSKLKYPVGVCPKLDGIRALVIDGVVYSRNMKPIRNAHVQKLFGKPEYNGFDGELIVGDVCSPNVYNATSSGVMSADGTPDVTFYVFDLWNEPTRTYTERVREMVSRISRLPDPIKDVPCYVVASEEELLQVEERYLALGYEGVMVRGLDAKYKNGRSSLKEGILLKFKRFEDAEAVIVGFEELMRNENEATKDELGRTKRAGGQAGWVPAGMLGAFKVKGLNGAFHDVAFDVGSGFTTVNNKADNGHHFDRQWLWDNRDALLGKIIKYTYFAVGVLDKPRFPIFHGFRDPDDM